MTMYLSIAILKQSDSPMAHCFFKEKHYQREFDVKEAYRALKLIPDNASVSAQSALVPHLAFRDTIYQYPNDFLIGKNCEYYAFLSSDEPPFQIYPKVFQNMYDSYSKDSSYKVIYFKNHMMIVHMIKRWKELKIYSQNYFFRLNK